MKTVSSNLPKQLLFLITLILAIAPACKQQNRRAKQVALVATGGVITAAGTVLIPPAFIAGVMAGASPGAAGVGTAVVLGAVAVPAALVALGIWLITLGIKKDKTGPIAIPEPLNPKEENVQVLENNDAINNVTENPL